VHAWTSGRLTLTHAVDAGHQVLVHIATFSWTLLLSGASSGRRSTLHNVFFICFSNACTKLKATRHQSHGFVSPMPSRFQPYAFQKASKRIKQLHWRRLVTHAGSAGTEQSASRLRCRASLIAILTWVRQQLVPRLWRSARPGKIRCTFTCYTVGFHHLDEIPSVLFLAKRG